MINCLLSMFLIYFSCSAYSLIIQHDVDPVAYLELGRSSFLQSVGRLDYPSLANPDKRIGECTAILLDPRTIVTAKHCLASKKIQDENGSFYLSDRTGMNIETKFKPVPRLEGIFSERSRDQVTANDVVFLHLENPIMTPIEYLPYASLKNQREPAEFYRGHALIAGHGVLGRGHEFAQYLSRGRFAGFAPIVEHLVVDENSMRRGIVRTRFDYLGHGQLGAGTASGDSGGPLLIVDQNTQQHVLVGILSGGVYEEISNERVVRRAHDHAVQRTQVTPLRSTNDDYFHHLDPLERNDDFGGYETNSEFAYLGAFDVEKYLGSINVRSSSSAQNWSDLSSWTAQDQNRDLPKKISNHEVSTDKIPRFFNVEIAGSVFQDFSADIDALRLTERSSVLVIPSFLQLKSAYAEMKNGHMRIDGKLRVNGFTLFHGSISGGGSIEVSSLPKHHENIPGMAPSLYTLQNHGGRIDLGVTTDHLLIEGGYSHERDASLSVFLSKHGSSKLLVSRQVNINGGALRLNFDKNLFEPESKFVYPSMMMQAHHSFSYFADGYNAMELEYDAPPRRYSWTVLEAKSIGGRFSEIIIDKHSVPSGYKAEVSYLYAAIQVTLIPTPQLP